MRQSRLGARMDNGHHPAIVCTASRIKWVYEPQRRKWLFVWKLCLASIIILALPLKTACFAHHVTSKRGCSRLCVVLLWVVMEFYVPFTLELDLGPNSRSLIGSLKSDAQNNEALFPIVTNSGSMSNLDIWLTRGIESVPDPSIKILCPIANILLSAGASVIQLLSCYKWFVIRVFCMSYAPEIIENSEEIAEWREQNIEI